MLTGLVLDSEDKGAVKELCKFSSKVIKQDRVIKVCDPNISSEEVSDRKIRPTYIWGHISLTKWRI